MGNGESHKMSDTTKIVAAILGVMLAGFVSVASTLWVFDRNRIAADADAASKLATSNDKRVTLTEQRLVLLEEGQREIRVTQKEMQEVQGDMLGQLRDINRTTRQLAQSN